MSCSPANNSKRYWLLPVRAIISCREKSETNENIIHGHLWKCLILESSKRVPGLLMIITQHRFVDSQPEFTTTPQSSKSQLHLANEGFRQFTSPVIDNAHKKESDLMFLGSVSIIKA